MAPYFAAQSTAQFPPAPWYACDLAQHGGDPTPHDGDPTPPGADPTRHVSDVSSHNECPLFYIPSLSPIVVFWMMNRESEMNKYDNLIVMSFKTSFNLIFKSDNLIHRAAIISKFKLCLAVQVILLQIKSIFLRVVYNSVLNFTGIWRKIYWSVWINSFVC